MRPWMIYPFLAMMAALGGITTVLAIDTSSALYTANIQLFNLGITRENFAAATEISGSALIDDAFMNADTLNAVVHEGPFIVPSMPPNNRIVVQDCVIDDGGSFTDWQTECADATELDFPLLPASPAVDDAAYFACDNPCRMLTFNIAQEAIADDLLLSWEYFNGTSFVTASNVTDLTNSFTEAGMRTVSFDMPSDFATTSVTGSAVGATYWVRGRVTDVSTPTQQALGTQAWYENGQWWMWGREQSINEELLYNLSVGGPDLVTNQQIFPGDAGVITPDDASVELGDTYAIHWEGALDFTPGVVGSNICVVCKDDAISLTVTSVDPNAVTLSVTGAGATTLTLSGIPHAQDVTGETVAPHKIDIISDGTDLTLTIDGVGTTSGTAQTVVDNANDWEWMANGAATYANQIYILPDETSLAFELFDTETQWDTGTLTDVVSTGGQPALELRHLVEASADDGVWREGDSTFLNNITSTWFGFQDGTSGASNSFHRFDNLRIEQGATIVSAELVFTAFNSNTNNTVTVAISAIDEDDAAAPSTFAGAEAAPRTAASVSWTPVPSFTAGATTQSPDLVTIIQEIVDRPGWASGNSIVMLVEDDGSTAVNNTRRFSCTFEAECEAVRLEVTIDTGETFTDDFIEQEVTATTQGGFLEDWTGSCSGTGCAGRGATLGTNVVFGNYAGRVRAGTTIGTTGQINQTIMGVVPGQAWSFRFAAARTVSDDDTISFLINWADSGGTLSTVTTNIPVDAANMQFISVNNQIAPAGADRVNIQWEANCGAGCGAASGVFIDGVVACVCNPAPSFPDASNLVANPSFESVYQAEGTWVSPSINLTQTDVESSSVVWTALEPFDAATTVEVSLDGGMNWTPATNGDSIPGIDSGDDVSGETLLVRVAMTPSTDGGNGQLFSAQTDFLAIIIVDDVLEDSAILFYELRTTPGVTIEDLSPNSNDGIMSYPVQLTGIFSQITPLRSNRVQLTQQAAIGVGDFAAPVTGTEALNLFGNDTGADFIPFVAPVVDAAEGAGFPTAWLWVIAIMLIGIAAGAFVWRLTDGNELMVSIVMAAALVFAAMLGDGLIPGWVPFVAIVMLAAYNILRSRLPI